MHDVEGAPGLAGQFERCLDRRKFEFDGPRGEPRPACPGLLIWPPPAFYQTRESSSAWTATGSPSEALRAIPLFRVAASTAGNSPTPLSQMNALNPMTPASASSGRLSTFPGTYQLYWAKSMQDARSAAALFASNAAALIVGGSELSGMSKNIAPSSRGKGRRSRGDPFPVRPPSLLEEGGGPTDDSGGGTRPVRPQSISFLRRACRCRGRSARSALRKPRCPRARGLPCSCDPPSPHQKLVARAHSARRTASRFRKSPTDRNRGRQIALRHLLPRGSPPSSSSGSGESAEWQA